MYPTRTSSAGVELLVTRFENVAERDGFICAVSG